MGSRLLHQGPGQISRIDPCLPLLIPPGKQGNSKQKEIGDISGNSVIRCMLRRQNYRMWERSSKNSLCIWGGPEWGDTHPSK